MIFIDQLSAGEMLPHVVSHHHQPLAVWQSSNYNKKPCCR